MYPTLDELVSHSFFKGGDVSGLEKFNPGPVRLSSNVKQLLKLCRKESEEIQRKRRPSTKKAKSEDREAAQKDRKLSKSKSKRPPVDKPAAVPVVQFHPQPSSPPNIQLPPPKEAPPPPRSKRQSSYDRAPPKLPGTTGRGALLSQIQKGAKLKKAVTNDRSAPRV